jgi:hypothetical protein
LQVERFARRFLFCFRRSVPIGIINGGSIPSGWEK